MYAEEKYIESRRCLGDQTKGNVVIFLWEELGTRTGKLVIVI